MKSTAAAHRRRLWQRGGGRGGCLRLDLAGNEVGVLALADGEEKVVVAMLDCSRQGGEDDDG